MQILGSSEHFFEISILKQSTKFINFKNPIFLRLLPTNIWSFSKSDQIIKQAFDKYTKISYVNPQIGGKRGSKMLKSLSWAFDSMAWRGLVYTVFILHFVLVCQLLLLQPLVSALGQSVFFLFVFVYLDDSIKLLRFDDLIWGFVR